MMRNNGLRQNQFKATTSLSSSPNRTRLGLGLIAAGALGALTVAAPQRALAMNLYDGAADGNQLEINLNTTISYQNFYRVNDPSAILTGPGNANGSEGDINFRHGFVSNEFEILPVLDIKDGDYGAHVSGEAYINPSYLEKHQNNQPDTFNEFSVGSNRDFTSATRNVEGENAKLLDAFVYGTHVFGQQIVTLKVGRQTLLWGQSLFFSGNGIAAGMAPIDVITAQNLPNAQTQQIISPVGQVVLTYQPTEIVTLQGYYQFEWAPYNLQAVGAYFNPSDLLDKGGERLILGADGLGPLYAFRTKSITPPIENGQFGASVQLTLGNYDLGLYGLRYDAKTPEVYLKPGAFAITPNGQSVGNYYLVYPRDIQIYGAAASTTVGPVNVAGELSGRRNMPLVGGLGVSTPADPGGANNDPLYPVGNTMAAQVSALYLSPALPFIPGGVSIAAELAGNHVINVTKNKDLLAPNRNETAAAFEFTVTPSYFDVLPNLTVTFPIGLTYDVLGKSQVDSSMTHGNGAVSFGVTGTYKTTWIASLTYNDYLGRPNTTYNNLADRGYLSFNVQHSF